MAQNMIIYSWNMFFLNAKEERAFHFIAKSDFDIFCLQEVPEDFLERLQTLPMYIAYTPEEDRRSCGKVSTQYLVVLSRYPIRATESMPIPYEDSMLSWRGRMFLRLMYRLRLWVEGLGNRHNFCVTIDRKALGVIRLYNLHLPLRNPLWRMREFEMALVNHDSAIPTIVCGDFNILEAFHITILNWFLGGQVSDVLFHQRERARIEKRFVEHELVNPLRGWSTHPLSLSQLDHILVSRSFSIKNADVIRDRAGSDHHPIRVEVA